jgi:endogenous inhibitor of DNA gyrase (YacG/DUF329 family)
VAKSKDQSKPSGATPPKKGRCPRCGKQFFFESVAKHKPFPFCCDRCRDVDMGNWLTGKYSIPGKPLPPETNDEDPEDAT